MSSHKEAVDEFARNKKFYIEGKTILASAGLANLKYVPNSFIFVNNLN